VEGKKGQQKISAMFAKKGEAAKTGEGPAGQAPGETKPLAQLVKVDMGFKAHDSNAEGRVIVSEFESFYVVGAYVPNSGMQLERLKVRRRDQGEEGSGQGRALAWGYFHVSTYLADH
jgi:exonuclease III